MWKLVLWLILCSIYFNSILSRKHHLRIENDNRKLIPLSSFGFFIKGTLLINMTGFQHNKMNKGIQYGFTLGKSKNDGAMNYLNNDLGHCILQDKDYHTKDLSVSFIVFKINELLKRLDIVRYGADFSNLSIYPNELSYYRGLKDTLPFKRLIKRDEGSYIAQLANQTSRVNIEKGEGGINGTTNSTQTFKYALVKQAPFELRSKNGLIDNLPITVGPSGQLNTQIFIVVNTAQQEGLYSFSFHTCGGKGRKGDVDYDVSDRKIHNAFNFTMDITEYNNGNYLSAGDIPLPLLYFTMSCLFFICAIWWAHILRQRRGEKVFKIHYLMLLLVCLKSISLIFHGVNFHFIAVYGYHIEAWAILYYVTHLLKGAFLFITIILIGSGWAFIKHVLGDKDKKIFMIVIPLQILVNVAQIIIEESEEGDKRYSTWKEIFTLLDLVCCGAILFPVVWSIRHLQLASRTDGKAVTSLEKLKLFRQFYIMIVCYVYFTRIIVYLLQITVPFRYQWVDEFFREIATFAFFVFTGYIFRPVNHNPYLTIPSDDDFFSRSCTVPGLLENVNLTTHGKQFLSQLEKREKKRKSKLTKARKERWLGALGLKPVNNSTKPAGERMDLLMENSSSSNSISSHNGDDNSYNDSYFQERGYDSDNPGDNLRIITIPSDRKDKVDVRDDELFSRDTYSVALEGGANEQIPESESKI